MVSIEAHAVSGRRGWILIKPANEGVMEVQSQRDGSGFPRNENREGCRECSLRCMSFTFSHDKGKTWKGQKKGERRGSLVDTQCLVDSQNSPRQFLLILYFTLLVQADLEDHISALLPNIAHYLLCTICQLHLCPPSVERNHHRTTAAADQILAWWLILNTTVTMTWCRCV